MWIKQRNHASETLLEKWAEPFSVFAERMITVDRSLTTPEAIASNRIWNVAPLLRQAWRILMENHPHDSICGCSIDQVHDEMRPRFDQADQIADEITLQSLQAISRAVDTTMQGAVSAFVLFNPLSSARRDVVEVALKLPDEVEAFELVDGEGASIAYEFVGGQHEELANLMLRPRELRDTIGAVSEGRVAGAALTSVSVTRDGDTVTIRAILDDEGQPNVAEWHQAEADIARFEADPSVTGFHVLAHTPKASTIRFVSPEVPALGWRTLWVRAVPAARGVVPPPTLHPLIKPLLPVGMRLAQSDLGSRVLGALSRGEETKPPFRIEDEAFVVEVERADGTLTVTDKRSGVRYPGLNRFVDGGDAGDEYNYCPPADDALIGAKVVSIKAYRDRAVPAAGDRLRGPRPRADRRRPQESVGKRVTIGVRSHVSLPPGVGRIDVRTEVDNTARDHRLRVHFAAPISVEEADHDSHFDVVRRPVGVPEKGQDWVEDPRPEVPQRAFTDISDGQVGLTIANRGLPEVQVLPGVDGATTEIALTLLRCVGWLSRDDMPVRQGHAGPAYETPGAQVPGTWSFDYAIIPHEGYWSESRDAAYAFQASLRAVETAIHAGELPASGTFLSTTPGEFVVSAVKETEDGSGWLVRGYNGSSEPITVRVHPLRRFSHAAQVNLAEDEMAVLKVARDGSVAVAVVVTRSPVWCSGTDSVAERPSPPVRPSSPVAIVHALPAYWTGRETTSSVASCGRRSLVVESGLEDDQVVTVDEVDQAVFLGDAARPGPGEHVAKRLGFADPGDRVAQGVVDEPVDPFEGLPVSCQPVGVVRPPVGGEDQPHRTRSCGSRWPVLACCRLSSRWRAFAGTRSRWAVSSSAS